MIELTMIGNLGSNATINETPSRRGVLNFNVCRSEVIKKRLEASGEEKKQWVDCAYFSDDTELLKLLTKGTLVFVKGWPDVKIHVRKDGTPTAVQYLKVSKIEILSKKKEGQL